MRLHDFLRTHKDSILSEWDAFATGLAPAMAEMSRAAVRDHAEEMLAAIAMDLESTQTEDEQIVKSKGQAPRLAGTPQTAAETHALSRVRSGFDVNEMVSEYRALRASVLRLWAKQVAPAAADLQDSIRFNEAIDQALAESVGFFSKELERARNLLLGMLGHDMRNPLHVVLLTAKHLAQLNAGEEVSKASGRLVSSGARLQALLDDLVDFNRSSLGVGIRVSPRACSLIQVFSEEVDLLRAANPNAEIKLTCDGNLEGVWDANRIRQLLGNLVSNAVKYGDASKPVIVSLVGSEAVITFRVANYGRPIPPELRAQIFEPLTRGAGLADGATPDTGMGLGLYIAREIARAHGGGISVSSEEGRTSFETILPRHA